MPDSVARISKAVDDDGNEIARSVLTWCPGCDSLHPFRVFTTGAGDTWEWDGNLERPTFSPSLLCYSSVHLCEGEHDPVACENDDQCEVPNHAVGADVEGEVRWRFPDGMPDEYRAIRGHVQPHTREPAFGNCHSFLRNGRWEFLSDSAHHLAGQTVDMVPLKGTWAGKDQ